MKPVLPLLLALLATAATSASAQSPRLQALVPGGSAFAITGHALNPCDLPLPAALEGAGRDLLLRLDTQPRPDCSPEQEAAALRFELHDLMTGAIDADGLHRVFMVDHADTERSLGMRFIELGAGVDWAPENGQWWPERGAGEVVGPGTGMFIELQNGALSLFFATYDDSGRADWLMAAGVMEGRIFRGDLLRFSGGTPPFASYRRPGDAERVASVELAFHSPSRAELWLIEEGEAETRMQMLPLTRFLFGHPADARAWTGEWVVAGLGGDGTPPTLTFDRIFASDQGPLLVDASGSFELACSHDGVRPDTLPQRCTLYRIDDGAAVAEFDGNGLDQLNGHDAAGNPVSLSRR
jgi:hypothetical protein